MDNIWIKYGYDIHSLSIYYPGTHRSGAPLLLLRTDFEFWEMFRKSSRKPFRKPFLKLIESGSF